MTARPPGAVRIIGGRWRGTKLAVPDRPGLRPTSDRVRETLFNWLMPMLPGARVLDAFAGSGALGLEAVSRGARSAVSIERDPALARALRQTVERLGAADRVDVIEGDSLRWLARAPDRAFDLIFLDPPFAGDADGGLWMRALVALEPWLAQAAWLYLESPHFESLPSESLPAESLPAGHAGGQALGPGPGWRLHREGRTREVRYALYRRGDRQGDGDAGIADEGSNPPAGPSD